MVLKRESEGTEKKGASVYLFWELYQKEWVKPEWKLGWTHNMANLRLVPLCIEDHFFLISPRKLDE
jgi:hypothetical protein